MQSSSILLKLCRTCKGWGRIHRQAQSPVSDPVWHPSLPHCIAGVLIGALLLRAWLPTLSTQQPPFSPHTSPRTSWRNVLRETLANRNMRATNVSHRHNFKGSKNHINKVKHMKLILIMFYLTQ